MSSEPTKKPKTLGDALVDRLKRMEDKLDRLERMIRKIASHPFIKVDLEDKPPAKDPADALEKELEDEAGEAEPKEE